LQSDREVARQTQKDKKTPIKNEPMIAMMTVTEACEAACHTPLRG